jgi:hypothetical protein
VLTNQSIQRRRMNYIDIPPEGPAPLENGFAPPQAEADNMHSGLKLIIPPLRRFITTKSNSFGLFREYFERPNHLPDSIRDLSSLTSRSTQMRFLKDETSGGFKPIYRSGFGPCKNASLFAFEFWWWVCGGKKTLEARDQLLDLLFWDRFDLEALRGINLRDIDDKLSAPLEVLETDYDYFRAGGWKEYEIELTIPIPNRKYNYDSCHQQATQGGNPAELYNMDNIFKVPGFYIRRLSTIISEALTGKTAEHFHWLPFRNVWKHPTTLRQQDVYGELYSSKIWMDAHQDIQHLEIPGCSLPRAVAALMFWSDSTCVSQFGTHSLWPIYLFFGNQSKYERSRPSSMAGHHVAFLPKVHLFFVLEMILIPMIAPGLHNGLHILI